MARLVSETMFRVDDHDPSHPGPGEFFQPGGGAARADCDHRGSMHHVQVVSSTDSIERRSRRSGHPIGIIRPGLFCRRFAVDEISAGPAPGVIGADYR